MTTSRELATLVMQDIPPFAVIKYVVMKIIMPEDFETYEPTSGRRDT